MMMIIIIIAIMGAKASLNEPQGTGERLNYNGNSTLTMEEGKKERHRHAEEFQEVTRGACDEKRDR